MASALDHFVADFKERSRALPGGATPWVERMRRLALEHFAERGFPSPHEEEWKYTNVEPLARHRFEAPARARLVVTPEEVRSVSFGEESGQLLVFVDGHFAPELSRSAALPRGSLVVDLARVLAEDPARLEPYLGQSAAATPFSALNTAFCSTGALVLVPRGQVIENPVHLLYLTTAADAVTHPRTVVVLEEGAQATLIEHYRGPDGAAYFSNAVTQVFLGANASLDHYKLQFEGDRAYHVAAIAASQQRDSRFRSHSIAVGGALTRTDIGATLADTGCDCTLNGLYLASGSQLVDHHIRIDHAKPHGSSRVLYRGILDGAARGVFAGRVVVHKDAQKTDAHLANHNLLLSQNAEADTKPQLEIYADDVKCGHGTTVAQLDENMLFYLRSRGIPQHLAAALLTYAFAQDVVGRMGLKEVRARLEEMLLERLPQGALIREFA